MLDSQIYNQYCKFHNELCKYDFISNEIIATRLMQAMIYTHLHENLFSDFTAQDIDNIKILASYLCFTESDIIDAYHNVPKDVIFKLHKSIGSWGITLENYRDVFGTLFERYITKKESGAYYTMPITTRYITERCICTYLLESVIFTLPLKTVCDSENPISLLHDIYQLLDDKNKQCFLDRLKNLTIVDPTCGTGAFIIQAFNSLLTIYTAIGIEITQDIVKHIVNRNLFGVDIDLDAILILKFRLFVLLQSFGIQDIIPNNFKVGNTVYSKSFNWDAEFSNHGKFDIVIGNPPYIELSKTRDLQIDSFRTYKCGNLYAVVMEQCLTNLLADNGVLGFIVPISIATTPRMEPLREILYHYSGECFYSHYADRPGCLFSGVHQKLTICILTKNKIAKANLYTSSYFHWEKESEDNLFSQVTPYPFKVKSPGAIIPKISSSVEESIIEKVAFRHSDNILSETISKAGNDVWLNMRMCFWCKAFLDNKGSNEYKRFSFDSADDAKIFAAFLNTSLFFFLWETMSDCWHITMKEIGFLNFSIRNININVREEIIGAYDAFAEALEKSKKYIGSKQTDYIYQHKLHKYLIDKIDEAFAKIFGFTSTEIEFIKNYQIQYRLNTEHKKPMTVIDVFSGAGGLSLGFEQAGFDIALANEIDSQIALTYRCNHLKTLMLNCDIREFVENTEECIEKFSFSSPRVNVRELKRKLKKIDVVIGGPPCQGFSMAGGRIRKSKALFEDPRNFLFKYYFRIIQKYEPKYFVFENVVGLLSSKNGEIIETIKELFQDGTNFNDGGYHLHLRIFNAADYGVPQNRKRVLIIGSKKEFDLDMAIKATLESMPDKLKAKFTHKTSVRDAIEDLQDSVNSDNAPANHKSTAHSTKAIERIKKIKPNQNYTSLDEEIKSIHSGSYGRLDWDKPATTITTRFDTPSAGRYIHPNQDRTITAREAARLQTFPDSFIFHGSKSSICTQIGNAVPPQLAEFIAYVILNIENS